MSDVKTPTPETFDDGSIKNPAKKDTKPEEGVGLLGVKPTPDNPDTPDTLDNIDGGAGFSIDYMKVFRELVR